MSNPSIQLGRLMPNRSARPANLVAYRWLDAGLIPFRVPNDRRNAHRAFLEEVEPPGWNRTPDIRYTTATFYH